MHTPWKWPSLLTDLIHWWHQHDLAQCLIPDTESLCIETKDVLENGHDTHDCLAQLLEGAILAKEVLMPHIERACLILDVRVCQEDYSHQYVSNLRGIHEASAHSVDIDEVCAGVCKDGGDVYCRIAAAMEEPQGTEQELHCVAVNIFDLAQVEEGIKHIDIVSTVGMPASSAEALTVLQLVPSNLLGFGLLLAKAPLG